jgi:hypothetical protein
VNGKFAVQDALCVSWRENLNSREINEALYLVNGCNPMDAAPQLCAVPTARGLRLQFVQSGSDRRYTFLRPMMT